MGFAVTMVKDADLAAFDTALQSFQADARGADLALFYFAGHGFAVADGLQVRNYLMSTSADVTSKSDRVIRAGGMPLDEVIDGLAEAAKTTLVFVDACRNDPRVRAGGGESGRGLARILDAAGNNVFVGLSTRLGDVAADGEAGEGSPFARSFAAHMAKPGLRVDDAFAEVRKAVISETDGDQRPEAARDDLDAPLVLVRAEPAADARGRPVLPTVSSLNTCAEAKGHYDEAARIGTREALEAHVKFYGRCRLRAVAEQRIAALGATATPSDAPPAGAQPAPRRADEEKPPPEEALARLRPEVGAAEHEVEERSPNPRAIFYEQGADGSPGKAEPASVSWKRTLTGDDSPAIQATTRCPSAA